MGLEPLLLLFKICFSTFHQERRDYFGRGAILSGIIVLCNILMNYCALPEGLRILGKVLSVDINSPGAQGFTSKHWQSIFIQLLVLSMGATGCCWLRRFWLTVAEWSTWGSQPDTNAGKSLFRIQLNACGSIHNTVRWLRQSALTRTNLRHQSFWSTLRKRSRNVLFITVSLASWRTQAVLL